MTAIQIIPTDFRAAPALMQLLQRRRAALVAQAPGAKADVLVVSAQREAALGGAKGLAELARGAGAKTLVVVAEDAATFALQPEMGGRFAAGGTACRARASCTAAAVGPSSAGRCGGGPRVAHGGG